MNVHQIWSIEPCKSIKNTLTWHRKPPPPPSLSTASPPAHPLTGPYPSLPPPQDSPKYKDLCTYPQSLIKTFCFTFGHKISTWNVTKGLINNFLTGILLTTIFHHTNYLFLSPELGPRNILAITEGTGCTDWLG